MDTKIKLTVFTPTYNRLEKLERCYHSLVNQTNLDFLWLIVDDGSKDETKAFVEQWIKEKKIRIEYIYQNNAGKQRAVNTGISNCKTEYFAFLDSDDYFRTNTVARIYELFPLVEEDDSLAGIVARRGNEVGVPVVQVNFIKNIDKLNMDVLYKKWGSIGETCRIYKLSILKKFLYPIINDKFILESYMLSQIDQKYDVLFVNEVFSISKYYSDGYTLNANKLYHNNPYGYLLGIASLTNSKRGFIRNLKYMALFINWKKLHKLQWNKEIHISKFLQILAFPLAICFRLFKYPRMFFEKNL